MLIKTYSDPDTNAHAEATMNRVLRSMDDLKLRFIIHHIVMAGTSTLYLEMMTQHHTQGSQERKQSAAQLSTKMTYMMLRRCKASPQHTHIFNTEEKARAQDTIESTQHQPSYQVGDTRSSPEQVITLQLNGSLKLSPENLLGNSLISS